MERTHPAAKILHVSLICLLSKVTHYVYSSLEHLAAFVLHKQLSPMQYLVMAERRQERPRNSKECFIH